MTERIGLLDFPNELLRHIKTLWHPFDLTANVCYYLLTDRTAACFDGRAENNKFWELLCRANGLSVTNEDSLEPNCWRQIAYDCARHAWSCEIPECGMHRLESNRALMESARTRWSSDWAYPGAIRRGPRAELDHDLDSNPVLGHIAFRTTFKTEHPYIFDTAYIRPRDQTTAQEFWPGTELYSHPIVGRSFAMFPPVATISSDFIFHFSSANAHGITVLDIFDGMKTILGQPTTFKEFRVLLDMTDEPEKIFPDTWPIYERVSALEQTRDWFKIVKTTEISFGKGHEGWCPEYTFAHRELPESPHSIHGLSSEDMDPGL